MFVIFVMYVQGIPIHNLVLNVLSFGLEKENLLISLKDENEYKKYGEVYFFVLCILFTLHIITRVRWVSPLLPFQVVKEFFCYGSKHCVMYLFFYVTHQTEEQQE